MIKRILLLLVLALSLTMYSQKFRIPQPNQNVKDAFSLASSIYTGHRNNVSFQNRINEIATLNISVSDPSEMIAEYTKKLSQLEVEAKERAKQKEIELTKKIDLINKGVQQIAKSTNNLSGWAKIAADAAAAVAKNAAIANAKKKIAQAKAEAQADLDRQLKTAMDGVYNKVMDDNKKAWDQYMNAAAQAFKQSDEDIYIANMEFHDCTMSSLKKNYDYKSTKWLTTSCKTPPSAPSGNSSSGRMNSGSSRGSADYNKALAYGSMTPEEQLAELDKQFKESMAKVDNLLANASDPTMKIELMSMKQDLIKKNNEEKAKIQSGEKQQSTATQKSSSIKYNSKDSYLAAAKRKHTLYNTTMKYPEFLEASKIYLEAEIAENPRNAEAYAFLGSISDDIAQKLAMSAFALYLDKRNPDYQKKFEEDRANFGEKLFASIKNGDVQFIDKADSYNLLKGFSYNDKLPLIYAIELDKQDMISKLNAGEYNDQQLLMLCIEYGGENTAKMYLDKMDLTQPIYFGWYDAFTYSIKNDRKKVSSYLLEKSYPVDKPIAKIRWKYKEDYSTSIDYILFWSIDNDNLDYFKYAANLKKNVDQIQSPDYVTVIESIIAKGRISLYDVLVEKKYKIVNDKSNILFLELAIRNDKEDMCLRLIDDGLDPKIGPSKGGSLMNIVAGKNGLNNVFDRLIKEGVDLSSKDSVGKIPMEIAFRAGQEEKAKKLYENGASIEFGFDDGGNQLHWIINNGIGSQFVPILAEKVDVNQQNSNGDSPMMSALKLNLQEHALALLKLGSSPDLCNNEKVTPLMYALEMNYPISTKMAVEVKDPNAIGPGGKSILHYAALANQIEVTMSMISKGATVVVYDEKWQTPFRLAKDKKNKVLAKLLKVNMSFSDRMRSTRIFVKIKNIKMFNKKTV